MVLVGLFMVFAVAIYAWQVLDVSPGRASRAALRASRHERIGQRVRALRD